MKQKYNTYKDFLIKEISNYKGDFNKAILYLPDIFSLLCSLLSDDGTTAGIRQLVNAALAYFVTPYDVIPEEIYGPYGYIDDLYLCTYVLDKIKEKTGIDFLKKHWEHEDNLEEVMKICLAKSSEEMQEKGLKETILKYTGLQE